MAISLQLLAILAMFLVTFLIFQALGGRRETLLYSRADKEEWDRRVGTRLGSWFTLASVVGTLTSLATVYLFFIGNSRRFGIWIFVCILAILGGAFVTNFFTRRICRSERVRRILDSSDQVGGVIASVFWKPTPEGRATARVVKYTSLINICALIWLDFALFADISGSLVRLEDLRLRMLLLIACAFAVIFFTLRYGLRGVVFADLFQSPMIALGAVLLFSGCVVALLRHGGLQGISFDALRPLFPTRDCVIFGLHAIFINLAFVLVTESHWLRLWIFRDKETLLQVKSISYTALLWLFLILIGFAAHRLSGGQVGERAIRGLLLELNQVSPIFIVAFWIGGIAALFASADIQVYSFLVVKQFNVDDGMLHAKAIASIRPFRDAGACALLFGLAYYLVRYFEVPFEKLVFLIIPISLNLFPAFVRAARALPQSPWLIVSSLILYSLCVVAGMAQPRSEFQWTWILVAALMPLLVSCIAAFGTSTKEGEP